MNGITWILERVLAPVLEAMEAVIPQTKLVPLMLSYHINTGDPIHQAPLPCQRKVQELLKDILAKNIISPSKSRWAFPIVLGQKKDGSVHAVLCRLSQSKQGHKEECVPSA